jgi:hypothetical protein
MQNQSVGSNTNPLTATFPAPQPWDAPDPLPVMRRELKLMTIRLRPNTAILSMLFSPFRHEFATASVNMGLEFRYGMAHQQRIIFKRQHCRRYYSTDPTERAASIPRNVRNRVHGRELSDQEKRRVAERIWHRFLRYGWPAHGPGDVA